MSHPETDMVSFTGSTRAGRRVSELAAQAVKPVSLELGGKSPNVILDDADLEQAVTDGVAKCYLNSGQTCSALTRMLVPRDKLEQVERSLRWWRSRSLPATRSPRARCSARSSPTPSASACAATSRRGEAEARLVTGGDEPPEGLDSGYFVRPTIFSDVTSDMTIAQEEIFGPCSRSCPTRTRTTPCGSQRLDLRPRRGRLVGRRGARQAGGRRIRTGQVEINGGASTRSLRSAATSSPAHGREMGRYGLEEFLEAKSLQL